MIASSPSGGLGLALDLEAATSQGQATATIVSWPREISEPVEEGGDRGRGETVITGSEGRR